MKHAKHINIVKETEDIVKMMKEAYSTQIDESAGVSLFFDALRNELPKIYLRPSSVIDAGRYSFSKVDQSLTNIGYYFRQELEDKFHYFNSDTSISVYLNPYNKKITFTP